MWWCVGSMYTYAGRRVRRRVDAWTTGFAGIALLEVGMLTEGSCTGSVGGFFATVGVVNRIGVSYVRLLVFLAMCFELSALFEPRTSCCIHCFPRSPSIFPFSHSNFPNSSLLAVCGPRPTVRVA
ncbi:hypothetical protein BDY21DRAFT_207078 [Lineolata rhizophorae]|uniref:Uncharacterized protein n=1 Tax=Lineolata rhizophorae TaxID=578093 RepID=A0A6A6P3K4_9PEZI|nr:hypothetical protein BDY21DRAFT_207078 [Lineolata rhizophorae]